MGKVKETLFNGEMVNCSYCSKQVPLESSCITTVYYGLEDSNDNIICSDCMDKYEEDFEERRKHAH